MATLKQLIECEISDFFAGFGHPGEPETPEEMQSQLLARVMPLLAGLEQEPVADVVAWHHPTEERNCDIRFRRHDLAPGPLYAAPQLPQPVPAVSADLLHMAASAIEDLLTSKDRAGEAVWYDVPAQLRRAAMLQGAEPVQCWIPCSERMPLTPEENCEYQDVEVQAFDGEQVLIAHYAIGSKPNPWGSWVDTYAEITHWQPLAAAPQQEVK